MSRVDKVRSGSCTRAEAKNRLTQAEAYLMVAQLCLSDDSDAATPGVAASLAVLAAIAAGDAACCHRLGRRARGQSHAEAAALVATINPNGKTMSKKFTEVLTSKDESHYGFSLVSRTKAKSIVSKSEGLVSWAAEVLRS